MTEEGKPLVDFYNTLYYFNEAMYRCDVNYTKKEYEAVIEKYFKSKGRKYEVIEE